MLQPLADRTPWVIFPDGRRSRSIRLRYALDAAYEGDLDLQAHEEPAGRSVPAGPLQARADLAVFGIEADDALEIDEQIEI